MLDPETKRKIRELRIPGMIEAVEMLDADPAFASLSFDERLRTIIDYSHQEMENAQVARLLRNAHLRLPQADVTGVDYDGRPLSRALITELATTQFVARATDVIIEGFTGTGKSFLACALGKQACRHGLRTLYVRMPDMLAYRAEKMAAGWPEKKVLNKYAAYKVLIPDEHLIDKPTTEQMHFLLELTERRYDSSSTIFCSQYPVDEWHRRMGGGAHAESIMDRIVHNAIRIQMGDVNVRERAKRRQEKLEAKRSS